MYSYWKLLCMNCMIKIFFGISHKISDFLIFEFYENFEKITRKIFSHFLINVLKTIEITWNFLKILRNISTVAVQEKYFKIRV